MIYCAILGNCASWIAYAYVLKNYFVFVANYPGIVMGIFYFTSSFALRKVRGLSFPLCFLEIPLESIPL